MVKEDIVEQVPLGICISETMHYTLERVIKVLTELSGNIDSSWARGVDLAIDYIQEEFYD